MKAQTYWHFPLLLTLSFVAALPTEGQGYIVPNGISAVPYTTATEIDVMHDPINMTSTGFFMQETGSPNTFEFDPYVDVGVRAFFVSLNQPVSLQPILSQAYTELEPQDYMFSLRTPFYVGLYTGNQQYAPPNGIYTDPLYGWAELENINGKIELLNSALEYQGGGIYAGTDSIFQTPEPSTWAIMLLGGAGACALRRWRYK